MANESDIHIPINRRRLIITGIFYGILTVLILVGFFLMAEEMSDGWKLALRITGGVLATLVILTGSGAIKLLQNKNAGLHITSQGIEDISSAIGVGKLEWKNIQEIEIRTAEKIVLVLVKKSDDILKSTSNKAIRQLLEKNISMYKTPVVLESKYLQCSFEEMGAKLEEGFKKFGSKKK
jgi:hypothetical protein